MTDLDMDKLSYADLRSSAGPSRIAGELTGFSTTGSGNGTLSDPVVTTQTALRTPVGQRILYAVKRGENAGLEGKTYRIANGNGVGGAGGLLMPEPTPGLVVRLGGFSDSFSVDFGARFKYHSHKLGFLASLGMTA